MGVHISRIQSLELDKLGTSELLVSHDLYLKGNYKFVVNMFSMLLWVFLFLIGARNSNF